MKYCAWWFGVFHERLDGDTDPSVEETLTISSVPRARSVLVVVGVTEGITVQVIEPEGETEFVAQVTETVSCDFASAIGSKEEMERSATHARTSSGTAVVKEHDRRLTKEVYRDWMQVRKRITISVHRNG